MLKSSINPTIDENFIINTPEGENYERKSWGINPKDLARHIVAFLNKNGGTLIVGVKDKKIENFPDLDNRTFQDFFQVPLQYITPYPKVILETLDDGNRKVLIYHITAEQGKVFRKSDNGEYYVRHGDESLRITDFEFIQRLYYEKNAGISFERGLCTNFNAKDFDEDIVKKYCEVNGFNGNYEDLFLARNLAVEQDGKILYTNAAILLFAKDPEKYISSACVRYLRFAGEELIPGKGFNITKDEFFNGPIPKIIDEIVLFLKGRFEDFYYFNADTAKFGSSPEYPEVAWKEGIINALTHRSYYLQGNPITIKHYDNRLEIANSGPLPSPVSVENIKIKRSARNPLIAHVLRELGYVKETSEGVWRIFDAMEKDGLGDPIYTDKDSEVVLTLKNPMRINIEKYGKSILSDIASKYDELKKGERDIIRYLLDKGEGKTVEISEYYKIPLTTLKRYLDHLVKLELIERHGQTNNSYYSIRGSNS